MKLKKSKRKKDQNGWIYLKKIKDLKSDKDFTILISVSHSDGTFMILPNCYVEEDDKYLFIVTEHHGRFCFEKELLNRWKIFK